MLIEDKERVDLDTKQTSGELSFSQKCEGGVVVRTQFRIALFEAFSAGGGIEQVRKMYLLNGESMMNSWERKVDPLEWARELFERDLAVAMKFEKGVYIKDKDGWSYKYVDWLIQKEYEFLDLEQVSK